MIFLLLIPFVLVVYCVRQLWFSPLSRIPGPTISALSSAWILYLTWSEQRNRTVDQLHKKYGPIVRLGPNEISISDPKYIKVIYSSGNYDKSDFYRQFTNYGQLNTFSSLDKLGHRHSRKRLNRMYSKSSVRTENVEILIQNKVSDLISYIESKTNQPETDIYEPFHALAMDVITGFIFGEHDGTSLLQNHDFKIIQDYRIQSSMWFWTTLMPRWWNWAADSTTINASKHVSQWNIDNCRNAQDKSPVLNQLANHGITGLKAYSEVQDHVAAGHETTGATLSFLLWQLSIRPDIQHKLQLEIKCAETEYGSNQLSFAIIDNLKYLDAVVCETLRLYAAIPGAEPRLVPSNGLSLHLNGENYRIPTKTVVSIQPWTLHRDDNVYEDALEFNPERWLIPDRTTLLQNFMPFGSGARMCIGMNLALMEIKLSIANIYSKYQTGVGSSMTPEDMDIVDKYTVHPKGHKCLLKFCRLDNLA